MQRPVRPTTTPIARDVTAIPVPTRPEPALAGGLIGYLNSDGKFSEFMHKMHWGIPNTIMSRAAMGDPTAADVANVVAYMQAVPFMEISAAQVVPAVAEYRCTGQRHLHAH